VIVQSSSAAMAITVTMAYMGWIGFETAAAIVLGENIGTTVTAYLASLGTNVNARRTARAHFLFNIFGVIWIAFVFRYFTQFILKIAPWDSSMQINLPLNLSLFHTVFNIINTLIFIPFTIPFAKLVEKLVKPKESDLSKEYSFKYIKTGLQDTGQMNIQSAKFELNKMVELVDDMFNTFLKVFHNPDKKMGSTVEKVKGMEDLSDQMQHEITQYLAECSKEDLSGRSVININAMLRIINELENIGDSCYKLMLLTEKKYDNKILFHTKAMDEFNDFATLLTESMELYKQHMNKHLEKQVLDLVYKLELKMNNLRDNLKNSAQQRLQEGGDVKAELLYLDLLKHFEHIGDNNLNIAQALRQVY
ncbi:MAG: Na/Pi cotransporter family protein, partial [Candidatus Cloacimonetes bacterium]|nr:Na/Pi cotransporter family protein [Candidatus Cloacimonadota bacterium]